ncbi:MAG: hypothetical protein ABSF46_08500 [Terriglobia bacterium]
MHVGLSAARMSLASAAFAALVLCPAKAATLHLNARTIYERAVSSNITLSKDGSTLELQTGEVIQDDGTASGFSYKPNQEKLSPGIAIRKQLLIADPRASKVVLMVGNGGNLKVVVNGHPQKLGAPQKTGWEWQAYDIDPAALKPGLNDIVISGAGMVKIARADDSYAPLPHRSARSTDGGKSWCVDHLGPSGDIAGEYYVRLYLQHFKSHGTILLPVMDVANLEGKPLAPPLTAPGPLRVALSAAPDAKSGVSLRVRSGTTYVPNSKTWSEWMPLDRDGCLEAPRGRFVQLEVKFAAADPRVTPKLSELAIDTEPVAANDWTRALKVVDSHNEEIVRTSIPFRYEPFTGPKLKELRARYHLDEVVGGAKTDLEIISKLAAWSSRNWPWQQWHLDQFYPSWDALEILKKLPDGKPVGGFCQQYDLVFLQACESFGFVGRDISIDSGTLGRPTVVGHEPMEIWSNQFHKWMWIDGTAAYYPEDPTTHTPLSLYEVRQRQLRVMRGEQPEPMRIVHIVDSVLKWRGLDVDMSFAEMRLIPRSNFLEQKYPIPLNNGKGPWTWEGFYVWSDAQASAELIHPNLVTRYGNFEWTLDQAHFLLEPTATDGQFRVHLDTETPGFETFLAQIDGGEPSSVAAIFPWKLHPGRNRLKVWPRNNAGRNGIASWVELEMPGK